MSTSTLIVERADGSLQVQELGDGRRKVVAHPSGQDAYSARRSCVTNYPPEVIQFFLESSGVAGVCEVIARDSDPETVANEIRQLTLAYCDPRQLEQARILDFGCGGGSSTVALATMFSQSQVVGVELAEKKLQLASARARHHGLKNVTFRLSPSGSDFPDDLGHFDFAYLFAVYEHLLPCERCVVMPLIWSALKPGGILFISGTPHRWFPIDLHSTRLPLINYLPDSATHFVARRFALSGGRVNQSPIWQDHLRGGIRGGTEREILRNLSGTPGAVPVLMEPSKCGMRDRCDYWYSRLSPRRRTFKKGLRTGLRLLYRVTGTVLTPNLSLAIQKQPS